VSTGSAAAELGVREGVAGIWIGVADLVTGRGAGATVLASLSFVKWSVAAKQPVLVVQLSTRSLAL